MVSNDLAGGDVERAEGESEPRTLVWAWGLVVAGNFIMRHFDDGRPGWIGLAIGFAGVAAMPYSMITGMRSTAGTASRVAIVLFHVAAVVSFLYFALTATFWK
ncbi:hypothetical protein [Actinomadura macrotermitis]|uniref:Uncharacterized protein n=1 Tax=Actinomadura macrotermitis TaxID=2585200 RepID=A0A7K0BWX7_9ACTN|nr:hypothetical protein [Actinomadura macrotermitis]MQY05683.1 hypothetical protein [Actinomadura macrotermitis]